MQSKIKDVDIHPGVVLGKPDKVTKKFPVAMISSKLPFDPPRKKINTFYQSGGLDGDVRLAPPKHILNAKHWKNKETGGRQSPMNEDGVRRLEAEMGAHFISRSTICCLFLISCR